MSLAFNKKNLHDHQNSDANYNQMLVVINLYSVRMRESPDQKSSKYGHFSHSTKHLAFQNFVICRHTNMSFKIENEKRNRVSYLDVASVRENNEFTMCLPQTNLQ